jgi:hypothetical protein
LTETSKSEKVYKFPVFYTQGGGLVREVSQNPYRYIFIERPDCPGLDVGDPMPEQWDLVPANQEARDLLFDEQFGPNAI